VADDSAAVGVGGEGIGGTFAHLLPCQLALDREMYKGYYDNELHTIIITQCNVIIPACNVIIPACNVIIAHHYYCYA
jgi:hypothetical protein